MTIPSLTAPDSTRQVAHPEDTCEDCGLANVVWFAPSEMWNRVIRAMGPDLMLCPRCFIVRAEAIGVVATAWRVAPEELGASPDDQQNDGAEEIQPATCLPDGEPQPTQVKSAQLDNGSGLTSAGGESGLPHRPAVPSEKEPEPVAVQLETIKLVELIESAAWDAKNNAEANYTRAKIGGEETLKTYNARADESSHAAEFLYDLAKRLPALLAVQSRNALLETQLAELRAAHFQALKDIEAACDSGMRLSVPASEIVGRIRAALKSLNQRPAND